MWQVRAEMVSRTGDLRAAKNRAQQRRCQAVWGDGCSCRGIGSKLDGEQLCRNTGCAWNWGLGSEKSLEVAAAGQGWRGLWAGLEGALGRDPTWEGWPGWECRGGEAALAECPSREAGAVSHPEEAVQEGVQCPGDPRAAPQPELGAPHGARAQQGKQNPLQVSLQLNAFHEIFIIPF